MGAVLNVPMVLAWSTSFTRISACGYSFIAEPRGVLPERVQLRSQRMHTKLGPHDLNDEW